MYVTDRSSSRIQVFDENGVFIDQFRTGGPSTPQVLFASADKHLWIADNSTPKIVKYDMDGNYQYSWGSQGEWPGAEVGPACRRGPGAPHRSAASRQVSPET